MGGGITGAFAAYFLARLGARPTIVERGEIGGQASGRNAGNLTPLQGAGIPGPMLELALASFRLHLEHADTVGRLSGAEVAPWPSTRLHLALDDEDATRLEQVRELYDATPGFSARRLDRREALVLEPRLAPDLLGGLLVEGNRRVDGGPYTRAVANAAVALGAETVEAEAVGLTTLGHRVTGVLLDSGLLPCDGLVLAPGAWCAEAAGWLDEPIPVEPVKGELLLVEPPGGGLGADVGHGLAAAYATPGRAVWLGDTEDRVGLDVTTTDSARRRILERVATFFPAAARAPVLGQTAGLRPVTPDGFPIVGRAGSWENVCLAAGAGRKGVLLSAGLGLAAAELLLAGETTLPIEACSPARFATIPGRMR